MRTHVRYWRCLPGAGLLGAALLADGATAQEVELGFGLDVVSQYVSQGLQYSDGPVAQPYIELSYGGFYLGLYGSTVDEEFVGRGGYYETTASVGYSGSTGKLSYDLSLSRYLYTSRRDRGPDEYNEVFAAVAYAASPSVTVSLEVGYADFFEQTSAELGVQYFPLVNGLTLNATVGGVDSNYGDWTYWTVGGSYQINDQVSADLTYHSSNVDPALGLAGVNGKFVVGLGFEF